VVRQGLLLQHCASLYPSLSGFLPLLLLYQKNISVELNLQPDRVTNKAAGSISIVAGTAVLAALPIIVMALSSPTPDPQPPHYIHHYHCIITITQHGLS
jgi:hypothetical protein